MRWVEIDPVYRRMTKTKKAPEERLSERETRLSGFEK